MSNPILICSPPAAVTGLAIARVGDDVVLTWSGIAGNYEVHHNNHNAYFTPDASSLLAASGAATFTDAGAAAGTQHHFYLVRSIQACGGTYYASAPSNRVGVFKNTITAGSPINPKYDTMASVIDMGIVLASQLVDDINGSTTTAVTQALKWDPIFGYISYDPGDIFSIDFPITLGTAVFVRAHGTSDTYVQIGDVPPAGSVSFALTGSTPACTYNFLSLPLDTDTSSVAIASELAADLGDVDQVLEWDPTFGYINYDPMDIFSIDFPVQLGYPYFTCMSASKTWPTPQGAPGCSAFW